MIQLIEKKEKSFGHDTRLFVLVVGGSIYYHYQLYIHRQYDTIGLLQPYDTYLIACRLSFGLVFISLYYIYMYMYM